MVLTAKLTLTVTITTMVLTAKLTLTVTAIVTEGRNRGCDHDSTVTATAIAIATVSQRSTHVRTFISEASSGDMNVWIALLLSTPHLFSSRLRSAFCKQQKVSAANVNLFIFHFCPAFYQQQKVWTENVSDKAIEVVQKFPRPSVSPLAVPQLCLQQRLLTTKTDKVSTYAITTVKPFTIHTHVQNVTQIFCLAIKSASQGSD